MSDDWCKKYVYVNSENGFYNFKTGDIEKLEEFNLRNGKHVARGESAFARASENGLIQCVSNKVYRPDVVGVIFKDAGRRVVNTYRRLALPHPKWEYKDDLINKVESRMIRHIRCLCEDDHQAGLLIDWLAHQLQHRGAKVPFCPVIIGFPGSGKGYIRALLRKVLVESNVGVVNPDGIESKYNTWATDKLVVAMEELNIVGSNRIATLNKLKPLITNEYVLINEYGEKIRKVKNVTNFFGLSNYPGALPLGEDDRRYWVISSEYANLDQFSKDVPIGTSMYFADLYSDLASAPWILRDYLTNHDISTEFYALRHAPDTDAKKTMILLEKVRRVKEDSE